MSSRALGLGLTLGLGAGLALTGAAPVALAASHSDAPLIKQDPQANSTDVYAFVGTRYDDPGQREPNAIVQVGPFSDPGDGAIYDRFADDARYSIHVAHPTTGATLVRYDLRFSAIDPTNPAGLKGSGTILPCGNTARILA